MKDDLFWEYNGHSIYVEEVRLGEWEASTVPFATQEAYFVPPKVRVPGGPFSSRHGAGMNAISYLQKTARD